MAASVEFLEKMQELQSVHFESENKRLQLEQELNSFVKSDTRMAKLKAVRLQSYWKKICEDEKRSQWRNEQLLQDFDRVDSHMAELSARTERLRVMKKQYEEYIERMYPQWKEKVIFMKQQRELAEKRAKEPIMNAPPISMAMHMPPMHSAPEHVPEQYGLTPPHAYGYGPHTGGPSSVSTGLSPSPQVSVSISHHDQVAPTRTNQAPMGPAQPTAVTQQFPDSHSMLYAAEVARKAQLSNQVRLTEAGVNRALHAQQSSPSGYDGGARNTASPMAGYREEIMSPGQAPPHGGMEYLAPSANSTLQTISSLPSGTDLTSIQARALAAVNQSADFSGAQTWESSELEAATGHGYYPQEDNYLANQSTPLQTIESQSAEESVESPKQATVRPMKSPVRSQASITIPDASGGEFDTARTDPSTGHTPRGMSARSLTGNSPRRDQKRDDELFDDDSLPLSPREKGAARATAMQSGSAGRRSRQNSQSSMLGDRSEDRSIYPEADVTLEGLYNLIDAVQEVLTMTRQTKEFYRTEPPPASVRNDIIENCNKGQMLTHVDPTSISMVALEQLPLVVQNCEGGSLLPDSYLYKASPDTDYDTIRVNIHPTSVKFWDRMCEHFVALVRYNIMDVSEVAEVFGPQLIGEDSPYEEKSKQLLSEMLDGVEGVDPTSPGSTATLSSMLTPKVTVPRPTPNEEVPPLDLPVSKSEDDDFFKRRVPNSDPSASLTQSAAYRQLLGTGMSTIKSSAEYEDSDESDDVEKQITKSITSPRPKFQSTAKPTAYSAPTTGSTPVAATVPAATKQSVDREEDSSPDLSPPLSPLLSPTSPPAYIPSALTSTGKSTLSMSSGKAIKKPGFNFGDSDTDEDVDLEGTGPGTKSFKHGDENDDFDFYG